MPDTWPILTNGGAAQADALPLSRVLKAPEVTRQEAITNKRRRPATRVLMMLEADALPARWLAGFS